MIKILCTGDWHIGNVFHGIDRTAEHRHFFEWLEGMLIERQPDALLVAGDVFDNSNPSAEAQSLYYGFLDRATQAVQGLQVVVTSGNHDSGNRLEAPRHLLLRHGVEVRGSLRRLRSNSTDSSEATAEYNDLLVPLHDKEGRPAAVVATLPYLRLEQTAGGNYSDGVRKVMKELCTIGRERYKGLPLVMMAHLYASGAEIAEGSSERIVGGQEQVALDSWEGHPDYFTCGHIHKRQPIWGTDWARYTGSILPMSFAERGYRHGVDLVSIGQDGKPEVEFIEYHVQHPLVSLPSDGAADESTLLQLIAALPSRSEAKPSEHCVYLELKLKSDNVQAEVVQKLHDTVERKDAIICRMEKVMPDIEIRSMNGEEVFNTVDAIIKRDPMDALEECFEIKNGKGSLGERRRQLLEQVVRACASETAQQDDADPLPPSSPEDHTI